MQQASILRWTALPLRNRILVLVWVSIHAVDGSEHQSPCIQNMTKHQLSELTRKISMQFLVAINTITSTFFHSLIKEKQIITKSSVPSKTKDCLSAAAAAAA